MFILWHAIIFHDILWYSVCRVLGQLSCTNGSLKRARVAACRSQNSSQAMCCSWQCVGHCGCDEEKWRGGEPGSFMEFPIKTIPSIGDFMGFPWDFPRKLPEIHYKMPRNAPGRIDESIHLRTQRARNPKGVFLMAVEVWISSVQDFSTC